MLRTELGLLQTQVLSTPESVLWPSHLFYPVCFQCFILILTFSRRQVQWCSGRLQTKQSGFQGAYFSGLQKMVLKDCTQGFPNAFYFPCVHIHTCSGLGRIFTCILFTFSLCVHIHTCSGQCMWRSEGRQVLEVGLLPTMQAPGPELKSPGQVEAAAQWPET